MKTVRAAQSSCRSRITLRSNPTPPLRPSCHRHSSQLLRATASPASASVLESLELQPKELAALLDAVPGLTSHAPPHEQQQQLELLQANVHALDKVLTRRETRMVLSVAPHVMAADLDAWFAFLTSFGFTNRQINFLLCQAPQALAEATLMSAGQALTTLREAGLDERSARALVVQYPQLLHIPQQDVVALLHTLSRFGGQRCC